VDRAPGASRTAGRIDRRELIVGLRKNPDLAALFELPGRIRRADGLRGGRVEAFFRAIDADGDGALSLAELLGRFAAARAEVLDREGRRLGLDLRQWDPPAAEPAEGVSEFRLGQMDAEWGLRREEAEAELAGPFSEFFHAPGVVQEGAPQADDSQEGTRWAHSSREGAWAHRARTSCVRSVVLPAARCGWDH
jgi:hypothetical protein